ncbi:MAG: hypothetical protein ACI9ZD_001293 [Paracoccaceae bacterium]
MTNKFLKSSGSAYLVLFGLFIAVLVATFAFGLSPEVSEILSLTLMFGFLGLRRRSIRSENTLQGETDFSDDDYYDANPAQAGINQGAMS